MRTKETGRGSGEEVLGITKITAMGQVTVPIDVRREFNFNLGDRLVFVKRGAELLVRKSK